MALIEAGEGVFCLTVEESVSAAQLRDAFSEGAPYYLGAMLLRPFPAKDAVAMDGGPEQVALDLMQMHSPEALSSASPPSWLPELLGGCYQRSPIALDAVAAQRESARQSLFEAGDIVFVPELPDWVAVYGAVVSPGRYAFDGARTARDFVEQAGGVRAGAESGKAFVYTPNGRKLPLAVTHWNYKPQRVPPGSIIVIPPWREQANQWLAGLRDEIEVASEPCR